MTEVDQANIDPSSDERVDAALHCAISNQDFKVASQLISLGSDVRAKNRNGVTPLHLAIANRIPIKVWPIDCSESTLSALRKNFYLKSCRESYHLAVSARNKEEPSTAQGSETCIISDDDNLSLVKMLLAAGADVNSKDSNDVSPLQCAVYAGDLELVKALIDAGADLDSQNKTGATALHDAVLCSNEAMVLLLLSRGASVTLKTREEGQTALHWASMLNYGNNRYGAIVRKLLEFGSDVNDFSSDKHTPQRPFDIILMFGDIDLVKLCIDEYKADLNLSVRKTSALKYAVHNEDPSVMNLVLESGITKCPDGNTALHHASWWLRPEHARQMIAKGADVNAMNDDDWPPLMISAVTSQPSIDYGIHPERPNVEEDRRKVMKLMLDHGADLNYRWTSGMEILFRRSKRLYGCRTALYMAIRHDNIIEAQNTIIEHAVELEARTNEQVFDKINLLVIDHYPRIKEYYEKCRAELRGMRSSDKIEGTHITYFSVLTEPLDAVARYARNKAFLKEFEANNYQTAYPVYASRLREKFDAALARRQRMEQVCTVLSRTLQFADPSHLAFEIVFKYLSEADVNLLIDSY